MTAQDIFLGGGGLLFVLLSLVQIAPVKWNPWSALAKAIGRAINAELMQELAATKTTLEKHIQIDDERNADGHRAKHAISNIGRVYDGRLAKHDFLGEIER